MHEKSTITEKVIPLLFRQEQGKMVRVAHANELGKNKDELLLKKFFAMDKIGVENLHNDYGVKSKPFVELIDNAERKCNVVFISTNLNREQMLERYGVRTLDRIKRLCILVKLKGISLRE